MTICYYSYYISEPTLPVYCKLLGLKTSSGIGGDGGRTLNRPRYNVVVALGQGTRPVSAALMQVTLAHYGLSGSSATALGT
jgi:hypothetical protein